MMLLNRNDAITYNQILELLDILQMMNDAYNIVPDDIAEIIDEIRDRCIDLCEDDVEDIVDPSIYQPFYDFYDTFMRTFSEYYITKVAECLSIQDTIKSKLQSLSDETKTRLQQITFLTEDQIADPFDYLDYLYRSDNELTMLCTLQTVKQFAQRIANESVKPKLSIIKPGVH